MNANSLDEAVTMAMHYTDLARALKGKPPSQVKHILSNELHWYIKAAVELNTVYIDCIDPNTAHLYPEERQRDIADRYAFQVECMIYRMQQAMEHTPRCHANFKERAYILTALKNFSKQFLPLAVPGKMEIPIRPPDPPADRHLYEGGKTSPQDTFLIVLWASWVLAGIILFLII